VSDISINITWWELLLYSPVIGWPGLLIGAVAGWLAWRKRPLLGAISGALAGNLIWFAVFFLQK
jgi:hypothetical protein